MYRRLLERKSKANGAFYFDDSKTKFNSFVFVAILNLERHPCVGGFASWRTRQKHKKKKCSCLFLDSRFHGNDVGQAEMTLGR
jgi:hypothetical protein